MEQGQQVGIEAQKAFPGGVLVDVGHERLGEAIAITRELVANPDMPAIFEATFEKDNVLVRVDVLERDGHNFFRILEVKSATRLKDEYLYDIGIQKHVLNRVGLKVSAACLMHLNREYVYFGGDYDHSKLFQIFELTPEIALGDAKIASMAKEQLHILEAPEAPVIKAGPQCEKPHKCEFFDLCNEPIPPFHVSTLPRISARKLDQLAAMNIDSIHAVADDFPLTDTQRIVRDAVIAGTPWIGPNLASELGELTYPLYSMDFETINPALPRFTGMRPYGMIPFQWSVHRIESAGAEIKHFKFLADDDTDPRIPFVESLIEALGDAGTIVVYNASFEKTRLQEIATALPNYAPTIDGLLPRIWDLLPCVRQNVYHPEFPGSYSLKYVLPALCPYMTYDGMPVANGEEAGIAFVKMIDPSIPTEDHAKLQMDLLHYCGQDTLGPLMILEKLRGLAGSI